jgi:ribosomal protein S18 acetylase RimI-like enzyme
MSFKYTTNKTNMDELKQHLLATGDDFIPPLHQRLDIAAYADKLMQHACRIEVWQNNSLVGLVAVYLNNQASKTGYISSVSVERQHRGHGLAKSLLHETYKCCLNNGFSAIELEVHNANKPAQQLYLSEGFVVFRNEKSSLFMKKQLEDNHVTTKL